MSPRRRYDRASVAPLLNEFRVRHYSEAEIVDAYEWSSGDLPPAVLIDFLSFTGLVLVHDHASLDFEICLPMTRWRDRDDADAIEAAVGGTVFRFGVEGQLPSVMTDCNGRAVFVGGEDQPGRSRVWIGPTGFEEDFFELALFGSLVGHKRLRY
jgi:hypothetical protein